MLSPATIALFQPRKLVPLGTKNTVRLQIIPCDVPVSYRRICSVAVFSPGAVTVTLYDGKGRPFSQVVSSPGVRTEKRIPVSDISRMFVDGPKAGVSIDLYEAGV